MKTKQIILYILLFLPLGLRAKNNLSAYWAKMDSIFMYTDRSMVKTGLLSDYGIQSIPLEYYDGALRDIYIHQQPTNNNQPTTIQ